MKIKRAEINSIMGVALNVCLVYENLYVRKIKIQNILKMNYSRITVIYIYTCIHVLTLSIPFYMYQQPCHSLYTSIYNTCINPVYTSIHLTLPVYYNKLPLSGFYLVGKSLESQALVSLTALSLPHTCCNFKFQTKSEWQQEGS